MTNTFLIKEGDIYNLLFSSIIDMTYVLLKKEHPHDKLQDHFCLQDQTFPGFGNNLLQIDQQIVASLIQFAKREKKSRKKKNTVGDNYANERRAK